MCFLLENAITIYCPQIFGPHFSYSTQTYTPRENIRRFGKWTNESNLSIANWIAHCGLMTIKLNLLCIHRVSNMLFAVRWLQLVFFFLRWFGFCPSNRCIRKLFCVAIHFIPCFIFRVKITISGSPKMSSPLLFFFCSANCYFLFGNKQFNEWMNAEFFAGVRGARKPLNTYIALAYCVFLAQSESTFRSMKQFAK